MKISNETKVGVLTAIAITILILGYNFMKGKVLFSTQQTFYAEYQAVDGLANANPVLINGYRVGQVLEMDFNPNTLKTIVRFSVDNDIKLTRETQVVLFDADLFGAKALRLDIMPGTETAESGDTLISTHQPGLLQALGAKASPITEKLTHILTTLDSATGNGRLEESMTNLNKSLSSLSQVADRTNQLMATNAPKLDDIFTNVQSITHTLSANKDKFNNIISNLDKLSDSIAASNFKQTIDKANLALDQFSGMIDKVNRGEGTLGQLANNPELYNNLKSSAGSLDSLLKDLQAHPKRYVHFSVFGGKKEK